jgi:branched-chain amino acid transport system ATP-binding protein
VTLLEVADVRKRFGGITALDGASLAVGDDEIVGLIGPNGAGKTTLFNCITGVVPPDEGTVRLGGRDLVGLEPYEIAREGLVRTFQHAREFGSMTVAENVRVAGHDNPGESPVHALVGTGRARAAEADVAARAADLLDLLELDHVADDYASTLSGGQRKLLALARALMGDPEILLLDEPFAGVNPSLTRTIVSHVESLNDDGLAFLVIEHELKTLVDVCDRLVVLAQGDTLVSGPPDEVIENDRVIDAYLGKTNV